MQMSQAIKNKVRGSHPSPALWECGKCEQIAPAQKGKVLLSCSAGAAEERLRHKASLGSALGWGNPVLSSPPPHLHTLLMIQHWIYLFTCCSGESSFACRIWGLWKRSKKLPNPVTLMKEQETKIGLKGSLWESPFPLHYVEITTVYEEGESMWASGVSTKPWCACDKAFPGVCDPLVPLLRHGASYGCCSTQSRCHGSVWGGNESCLQTSWFINPEFACPWSRSGSIVSFRAGRKGVSELVKPELLVKIWAKIPEKGPGNLSLTWECAAGPPLLGTPLFFSSRGNLLLGSVGSPWVQGRRDGGEEQKYKATVKLSPPDAWASMV